MRRWGFSAALAVLLVAAPTAGQDAPKSLLPDVFGAPPPEPTARPAPAPTEPGGEAPDAATADDTAAAPVIAPAPMPVAPDPFASAPTQLRSLDVAGPLRARIGGYGMRAFAESDGRFVTELLNRIDPPLASRWAHIVLRRALLSRVPTPAGVRPADWVAARALLLLRMGEVDGAKLLVDALPLDRYTPQLYGVASQVHLAAADIPALCPLAPSAKGFSTDSFWDLANAMCAGIDGDDITAATQFDKLRARNRVPTIDLVLAERVTTVTSREGRGANVEWDDVERLNAYRFGLATAAGIEIPERLTQNASGALAGWLMRAPGLDIERRAEIAPRAAAYGIASAAELAAIAATRVAALDPGDAVDETLADMRTAFAGRTPGERIEAMRRIWATAKSPTERYGRLIQTSAAAARIPPASAQARDAADLIRSMLSAGHIRAALAWWPVLENAPEDARLAAWPLLALADLGDTVDPDPDFARDWLQSVRGEDETAERKAAMLAAAMRGLGKPGNWGGLARDLDVQRLDNLYTQKLAAAATARRRGEVAVLAATGLQSDWSRVSPGQLEAIVSAYSKAGFRREARMLAIEALTRN